MTKFNRNTGFYLVQFGAIFWYKFLVCV